MDWGLVVAVSGRLTFRKPLLFRMRVTYVAAIIANLLLRCTWAFTLSSFLSQWLDSRVFIFEVLEVVRRSIWTIFRVENLITSSS